MAEYLTMPILNELIRRVEEDPGNEDAVKAMTSGILSFYFSIDEGFIVAPISTGGKCSTGFGYIIRHIQPSLSENRKIADHVVVRSEVDDNLQSCIDRLRHSIESRAPVVESCWAVLVQGQSVYFYEYHGQLPEHERLVPWELSGQSQEQHAFHVRRDSVQIEQMLRHMALHDMPARETVEHG
ncbi:hypothetical protein BO79DRAFT_254431 [Aspergillus costaricaensis CBS 115574]|uniref:Uncharacterized protein n=1 Tax=Aspergillus costaricaensis CBS 115574 TaxID=1448317 RepID=A0ACD1IH92_9EURO|nr:hypothetical protein BO79DRAFT_254431 [Aspergillus costaricaensis CBS 115574]RAK89680.1 hypothetical protein BO79DRAFT_254431 [Aspergillus costaricaensis CBS 115574]